MAQAYQKDVAAEKAAREAAVKAEKEAAAKEADRMAALAPYHRDSKDHFKALLAESPENIHHKLGVKHGWHILDVKCREQYRPKLEQPRVVCGFTIKDHVVDTRSSIADDLRSLACPQCGARGNWEHVKAPKPSAPKEK